MPTVSDVTERELIARLRQHLPASSPTWVVVGIGDDAAVVEGERNLLDVLTVDAIVEGVHFDRAFTPPDAIGHRALAVNLSDLAAMGARPRLALLSIAMPRALSLTDFDAIVDGIATLAGMHHVHVVGGNLTQSPGPLMVDVTAVGVVGRRQVLRRNSAQAGDELYVTGTLGGARAGLLCLQTGGALPPAADGATRAMIHRFLYPQPRVRTGVLVGRNRAASACMDLSDGLADALDQVTTASGVGANIDLAALPVDAGARAWSAARATDAAMDALGGGDDYELLFAVPRRTRRAFFAAATLGGAPVTRIGVCTPEPGVRLEGAHAGLALPKGFSHFR